MDDVGPLHEPALEDWSAEPTVDRVPHAAAVQRVEVVARRLGQPLVFRHFSDQVEEEDLDQLVVRLEGHLQGL